MFKIRTRCALAALALSCLAMPAHAVTIYIGDAAAQGQAITKGTATRADTVNPLTYAFTDPSTVYTAATNQVIKLTEVNFFADEGPGNLTPFVAVYNGGDNQAGASYNVRSIGAPLAVVGGPLNIDPTDKLENRVFLSGGANPQISLKAGQTLVAGFHQSSRIVFMQNGGTTVKDYIDNSPNAIPASVNNTLTSNGDFNNFVREMKFNVGMEVVNNLGPDQEIAYTGTTATRGGATGNLNIGRQFTVTGNGILVDSLGVFDFGGDGLINSHTVTLFSIGSLGINPVATPIAGGSVTVQAGQGADLQDDFRFADLAQSLVLAPGNYSLIAYGMNSNGGDPYGDNGGLPSSSSLIHFGFDPYQFTASGSPAYPTGGDSNNHTSVSFLFRAVIIPEPATITMGIMGLASLMIRRRRTI